MPLHTSLIQILIHRLFLFLFLFLYTFYLYFIRFNFFGCHCCRCGHCKKLAPTYEELAESLEDETDVVIAKMDGVDNEHEDIDAQGFPTILFFPAEEDAAPVTFAGDRTVQVRALDESL